MAYVEAKIVHETHHVPSASQNMPFWAASRRASKIAARFESIACEKLHCAAFCVWGTCLKCWPRLAQSVSLAGGFFKVTCRVLSSWSDQPVALAWTVPYKWGAFNKIELLDVQVTLGVYRPVCRRCFDPCQDLVRHPLRFLGLLS